MSLACGTRQIKRAPHPPTNRIAKFLKLDAAGKVAFKPEANGPMSSEAVGALYRKVDKYLKLELVPASSATYIERARADVDSWTACES